MTDHRPVYYVTDAEADGIRAWLRGGWLSSPLSGKARIYSPPGGPIETVTPTGRADCRSCGRRIHVDETAIRFGLVTEPDRGSRLVTAYIHDVCPEEETPDE